MMTTLRHGLLAAVFATTLPLGAQTHTHGSMVGSLAPTSVVVWTRASAAANVTVIFNTSPTLAGAKESANVLAKAADDFTAHIKLSGLKPDTTYHYATKLADPSKPLNFRIGKWGRFTTPPSGGATKVTFLASADVVEKTMYGIFDTMRKHPAAFFVSLGDMPYADTSKTQADFWNRHKDTRNHTAWLSLIEQFPVEAIWDDHEVLNDWDASTNATLVGYGKKAFFDYFPLPKASTEIYRTIQWGDAVEIFLLDLRAHRDANKKLASTSKTMLGATQKAWLKTALSASTARFKVLCSSVPVRWGNASLDGWDGFAHEREEILAYIAKNNIRNVVSTLR